MNNMILVSLLGYDKIVKLLLDKKNIDVNIKGNYRKTALIMSYRDSYDKIVKLLLDKKNIDVNIKDNKTALILASCKGYDKIVKLLLEKKTINVNIKDKYENTALILASWKGIMR